ncbi:MAG: hypothetical protein HN509_17815 [Halobacteriovoraceae bacterium]|nr:hypothetical protein [Halobacteriovoraceae bacterium]MBT5095143.1 hypothetical protein [Halobacteriovoraceae bacterium]
MKFFKQLFIAFLMVAAITGCGGSDSEESTGQSASPFDFGIGNCQVNCSQTFVQFGQLVSNPNNFRQQFNAGVDYGFNDFSNNSGSQNCDEFLGFIQFCYYSYGSSNTSNVNKVRRYFIQNGLVQIYDGDPFDGGSLVQSTSITQHHQDILNLVTGALGVNVGQDGTYYVLAADGQTVYGINFQVPLAGNPVYKSDTNGVGEYFYGQRIFF